MPARKQPKQGKADNQPKQTLIALKPFKKAEETPPVPPQEAVSKPQAPVADPPVTVQSTVSAASKKESKPQKTKNTVAPPPEKTADPLPPKKNEQPIFQAIGVLVGQVKFQENQAFITIEDKEFSLFPALHKGKIFEELRQRIEITGGTQERIVVYPKILHLPKPEKPYEVSFQLVNFDKGENSQGVVQEIKDFEFKLCGFWQFIPVCSLPCISVLKNSSPERLSLIKGMEAQKKVNFLKATHIPLVWRSEIAPFKFNPKLSKEEQERRMFVQVQARFFPSLDVFGFSELLAEPVENAPRFLKCRKEDKKAALQQKG